MECYYRYACKEGKGEDAAPLSKEVSGIFTLKGVWRRPSRRPREHFDLDTMFEAGTVAGSSVSMMCSTHVA